MTTVFQFSNGVPPIYVPVPNTTSLSIILTSSTVRIETEVEAFPFESFVADCGGVLGLFIGFNFLMIWGVAADLFTKYKSFPLLISI